MPELRVGNIRSAGKESITCQAQKCERAGKKPRWYPNVDDKQPKWQKAAPKCPRTHALSLKGSLTYDLGEISQIFVTFLVSNFRRTSTHLGCHEGKRKRHRLTAGSSADLAAQAVGRRGLPAGDGRGGKGGTANGEKRASGSGDQ